MKGLSRLLLLGSLIAAAGTSCGPPLRDGKPNGPCDIENGGCSPAAICGVGEGQVICSCRQGFVGDGRTCVDIDECGTDHGGCAPEAVCTNTPGSHTCDCTFGFEGDGVTCTDVDECAIDNGECDPRAACVNELGSRICICPNGYTTNETACEDIDECALGTDSCDENADCVNTAGDHVCTCRNGFTGDGRSCVDVDECAADNGGCDENAACTNTPGSRLCACVSGYVGDGLTCADVDECSRGTDNCHPEAVCSNVPGGWDCECRPGWTGDGRNRCEGIDACRGANGGCSLDATCTTSERGLAECQCLPGFSGDGMTCNSTFTRLYSYGDQTCALDVTGTLSCWGARQNGDIDGKANGFDASPQVIEPRAAWKTYSGGLGHRCGVKNDGTLWCWGKNRSGQLGDGTTIDRLSPTQIGTESDWTEVSVGELHACALKVDGTLWCWGDDTNSGVSDARGRSPERISMESAFRRIVKSVGPTTCVLRNDGTVPCLRSLRGKFLPLDSEPASSPLPSADAVRFSDHGSTGFECQIGFDSEIRCKGQNWLGQLGDGTTELRESFGPIAQPGAKWMSVAAGSGQACAVRSDGTLWCWGGGTHSANGSPTHEDRVLPSQLGAGSSWREVSCGSSHCCAADASGDVYCWGHNASGQVGDGAAPPRGEVLELDGDARWVKIAAGSGHVCGVKTDGSLWCSGFNFNGQAGAPLQQRDVFALTRVGTGNDWRDIYASGSASTGLTSAGQVYYWGTTYDDPTPRWEPTLVSAPPMTSLHMAHGASCGIEDSTQRIWCWHGAISFGGPTRLGEPVGMPGTERWLAVAGGDSDTCAIGADHKIKCWGWYYSSPAYSTPAAIAPAVRFVALDKSQGRGACAIAMDGALWCWGRMPLADNYSTAYDGDLAHYLPGTTWQSVSVDNLNGCGVRNDSTLWCWGRNDWGELGSPDVEPANVPLQVGDAGWQVVDVGNEIVCGVRTDGRGFCWGSNGRMPLPSNLRVTPVRVPLP